MAAEVPWWQEAIPVEAEARAAVTNCRSKYRSDRFV
jgi:hypothetical protein